MFSRIFRFFDTASNRLNWIPLISGVGIVSASGTISGWLAAETKWLASYGPISWWVAALVGATITILILIGIAYLRYMWIKGAAIREWQKETNDINPLDLEFTRRRIKIIDLVNPITRSVSKKRFIDCELMGPAIIMFKNNINVNSAAFINCDIVVMRPKGALVFNVASFDDVQIFGGSVYNCTIYIPEVMIDVFRSMGARFVSLTGRQDLDETVQSPPGMMSINPQALPSPSPSK